jgi:hypothetical protein
MTAKDSALLSALVTLLEPGENAWNNLEDAEAHYQLPGRGDIHQRLQNLLAALMTELEAIDHDQVNQLRRTVRRLSEKKARN